MPPAKEDRRVARTQQSLHRALNTLVLEKGYDATTIRDITDYANVGRSTFYAHHGSKEGLLLSGLQHLQMALSVADNDAPPLGFSRTFFGHVQGYREVLVAVLKGESGPIVTRKMRRMLAGIARLDLQRNKPTPHTDAIPRELLVQFLVETLFSVLLWWIESAPDLAPGDADAMFRRLVLPTLMHTQPT